MNQSRKVLTPILLLMLFQPTGAALADDRYWWTPRPAPVGPPYPAGVSKVPLRKDMEAPSKFPYQPALPTSYRKFSALISGKEAQGQYRTDFSSVQNRNSSGFMLNVYKFPGGQMEVADYPGSGKIRFFHVAGVTKTDEQIHTLQKLAGACATAIGDDDEDDYGWNLVYFDTMTKMYGFSLARADYKPTLAKFKNVVYYMTGDKERTEITICPAELCNKTTKVPPSASQLIGNPLFSIY